MYSVNEVYSLVDERKSASSDELLLICRIGTSNLTTFSWMLKVT